MFPNSYGMSGDYADSHDPAQARRLAAFFNSVYAWMAAGLGVTAVVAKLVSKRLDIVLAMRPLFIVIVIAQLILVWTLAGAAMRMRPAVASALFLLYAAINGLLFSAIFLVYPPATLGAALAVTAGTFAATSLWGFFTKSDLSRLGSVLFMALIGLVIASIVNIFVASSGLNWLINYAGVLIFVGLTAYDTQRLRKMAISMEADGAVLARVSVVGALTLYLDFINLFLFILRIMGNDRQR
jgi:FtsH-binding integral membrane protein